MLPAGLTLLWFGYKKDLKRNVFEDTYLNSAATRNYLKAEYDNFRAALADVGLAR